MKISYEIIMLKKYSKKIFLKSKTYFGKDKNVNNNENYITFVEYLLSTKYIFSFIQKFTRKKYMFYLCTNLTCTKSKIEKYKIQKISNQREKILRKKITFNRKKYKENMVYES